MGVGTADGTGDLPNDVCPSRTISAPPKLKQEPEGHQEGQSAVAFPHLLSNFFARERPGEPRSRKRKYDDVVPVTSHFGIDEPSVWCFREKKVPTANL